MSRALIIPFLMLLLVSVTIPGLATNTSTIELEAGVDFLTPVGEDVKLSPDTYQFDRVALKGKSVDNQPTQPKKKFVDPDYPPGIVGTYGFKALCSGGLFQSIQGSSNSGNGRIGCLHNKYRKGRINCRGNGDQVSVPGRDYCGTPGAVVEKPACPLNAKRLTVMSGSDRCGKRTQSISPRCGNYRSHTYRTDNRGAEDQCVPKKVPINKGHCVSPFSPGLDMRHRKVLDYEFYEDRQGANKDVCEYHFLEFQRPEIRD